MENKLVINESDEESSQSENEENSPYQSDNENKKDLPLDKNSNIEENLNVPKVLSRVELLEHFKQFPKISDSKFITIGLVS